MLSVLFKLVWGILEFGNLDRIMSRRVRRKGVQYGEKAAKEAAPPQRSFSAICDGMWLRSGRKEVEEEEVDWTSLPDDTVVQLFSCLNYRDRASLASTCSNWRALGSSPCLWSSLDRSDVSKKISRRQIKEPNVSKINN